MRKDVLKPDKINVQRTSVSGSLVTVLPKFGKGGCGPPQPNYPLNYKGLQKQKAVPLGRFFAMCTKNALKGERSSYNQWENWFGEKFYPFPSTLKICQSGLRSSLVGECSPSKAPPYILARVASLLFNHQQAHSSHAQGPFLEPTFPK